MLGTYLRLLPAQIFLHPPPILDLEYPPLLVAHVGHIKAAGELGAGLHLLAPRLPDVHAGRPAGGVVLGPLLVAVVLADGVLLLRRGVRARPHAEPEVVPLLAAGPHAARPVHGHPLPPQRVAVVRRVEGLPARHRRG